MRPALVLASVIVLAAAGCGGNSNGPATFVARDARGAALIQWTRDGSHVTGSVSLVNAPQGALQLQKSTLPFSGVVHGSAVTLSLNEGLDSTTNWTGTLHGKNLQLSYTADDGSVGELSLVKGTVAEYNAGVAASRALVTQAQQQQAQKEAATAAAQQTADTDQQIESDAQSVASDIESVTSAAATVSGESLASELSALRGDLKVTYTELQQVMSDSSDNVCTDSASVDADESSMEADDSSLEASINGFEADISSLQQDVSTVHTDYQAYLSDAQGDPAYAAPDAPSAGQVSQAAAGGRAAIRKARQVEASGRSVAAGLLAQGKQYAARGDARCNAIG
ncbi:MAG TPA: hypothetical protein VGH52_04150 [Gaiellaceae bacterium]|jgi:hypothetical protein